MLKSDLNKLLHLFPKQSWYICLNQNKHSTIFETGEYRLRVNPDNTISLLKNHVEILLLPQLQENRCSVCLTPNTTKLVCTNHKPFFRHGLPETPKRIFSLGYYYYDRSLSLANPLTQFIIESKRDNSENKVLSLLSLALGQLVKSATIRLDSVTYVPSFKSRSMINMYSANVIGRFLSLPVISPETWLIEKTTDIGTIELPLEERKKHVEELFEIKTKISAFQNKSILIIDDILASGETLSRIAFLIRKLGAISLFGAVLARTVLKYSKKGTKSKWLRPDQPKY